MEVLVAEVMVLTTLMEAMVQTVSVAVAEAVEHIKMVAQVARV
jgi:hypothetical protein